MLARFMPPAELPLLDPELRCHLGIVAAHLLDEPLRVLAADVHVERVAQREVGREGVADDGVDDHRRCRVVARHRSGSNPVRLWFGT